MARLSLRTRRCRLMRLFLHEAMAIIIWFFITVCTLIADYERDRPCIRYSLSNMGRAAILHRYAYESDSMCISQLRMNRGCFKKLCDMLETLGGLKATRNMGIDEQVIIFLHIMARNVKIRVITCRFHRSGETISRLFTRVCNAVIRLHSHLLKKPEPVREDSTDGRWKWFKVYKISIFFFWYSHVSKLKCVMTIFIFLVSELPRSFRWNIHKVLSAS